MRTHISDKDFYEVRAELTINRLYGKKYKGLVRSDKPDLMTSDNKFGIEVTRALSPHDAEQSSFFAKELKNRSITEVPERKIDRFCSDGTEIIIGDSTYGQLQGKIIGYFPKAKWHNDKLVIETIERKVDTISRKGYRNVEHLELYVFSDSFKEYETEHITDIVNQTIEYQSKKEIKFETLFFDDCGWFYRCDLVHGNIEFQNTERITHRVCQEAKRIYKGI